MRSRWNAGGTFSWVATPISAPIVNIGVVWLYGQVGVDPRSIPADASVSVLRLPGFKQPKE